MKKRLLSLVLCLVMVFALFPTFAAPAQAADWPQISKSTAPRASRMDLHSVDTATCHGSFL